MVYRAEFVLDNKELLREITLRWNTYSKTLQYPYDSISEQIIPSSATGLPADLKYSFTYIVVNPSNNLLVLSQHAYTFRFESSDTGQQESDKEWGLEGLVVESDRYKPLILNNDYMESYRLKPINKELYGWISDYHILNNTDPDELFTVYTYSSTPQIGDEVFTKRGEPLSDGMYILAPGPSNLQNMIITEIFGNTLILGDKT